MEINWLTTAEMAAWRAYAETNGNLANAMERDLAAVGLSFGEYQVLVFLSEADGRAMRMSDLATMLQLSPSGLTRRLDGLVAGGFVERRGSDEDRRVMMGVLTDDGFALLERSAPHHLDSVRRRLFDHLNDEQVSALESIFKAIANGLRESRSADSDGTEAVA